MRRARPNRSATCATFPTRRLRSRRCWDPAALGWFGVLQPSDQRFLLLEGYPEVYGRTAHAGLDFGGFKFVYKQMVGIVFDNRAVKLPPIEEAVSAGRLGQARLAGAAPVACI